MLVFKNNGIELAEFEKIREESRKICDEYGINKYRYKITIDVSNKFGAGTNGSFSVKPRLKEVRIALSLKTYKKYGFEPIIGTLKHEWAHFIAYLMTGFVDHGETFKEVCLELGGHMNKKLATGKYTACSNNQYLKNNDKKYKLSCPCGQATAYRDKINKNFLNRYSCTKCLTKVKNWKIEENRG